MPDKESADIKILPNPTPDYIYIEMPNSSITAVLELYNVQGKGLLNQEIIDNKKYPLPTWKKDFTFIRLFREASR